MRHFEMPARMGSPYQLSRESYHQMGVMGIIDPTERTELLDGEIIRMSPIGSRHARAVSELDHLLYDLLRSRAIVWAQGPLALNERSEPQPDLMVLRPREDKYGDSLPGPEHVLLLVEVSDSTIVIDCGPKLQLYAEAGIEEYWVVDLTTNALVIHRSPNGNRYEQVVRLSASKSPTETASPQAFPDCKLAVSQIFG